MDTGLEFGILGPLEVRRGGTLLRVGGPRPRALLAVLLCHANRVVSRDQRVDELLGDQPAGSAEPMLRVQISRLRTALTGGGGPPRVLARPPGYLLRVEPGELDLEVFEQRAAAARHMLEQSDPGQAAVLLRAAESLWRGRPLADLEFEPFARFEIQRLQELRMLAAEDRIEAGLALGQHSALCPELGRLVAEHPLRERLRGQLMVALYRSGRQAEALETYRAARSLLVAELAVEPGPGLSRLHEQLTAGVPAAQILAGLEARAGCWRDQVAGKKILLLLDDAAGHEQVRALLPGTPGSLVLITSRRLLTALQDAAVISLDTLSPGEAAELLVRLASRPDLAFGDAAVGEITRLCGYLPLAIGMIAGQLRHHPARTAGQLATGLGEARDRLAMMRAENLSVAAAFGLSYADLTLGQQRLFRRLGLIPGPSFDTYAAAALDGTSLELPAATLMSCMTSTC